MFALQNAVRRAPQLAKFQHRTVVTAPPRVRVSFAEKVALGVIMYGGVMAIPLWITLNVRNYAKQKK